MSDSDQTWIQDFMLGKAHVVDEESKVPRGSRQNLVRAKIPCKLLRIRH